MYLIKVSKDLWDLFPLKIDKRAEPISLYSSAFRARQAKRIEAHKNVRRMALALNYKYDDKIGYESATVNSKIASTERNRVSAFPYSVIGNLKGRSRKMWRRRFLKLCESAERIGLWTYGLMVKMTERPISWDLTGKKIGFAEPGTVASAHMLKLLPGRLRGLYSEKGCLKEPEQEVFIKVRKCLLVKEGKYAQLIQSCLTQELSSLFAKSGKKSKGYLASRKTDAKSND